MTRGKVLLTSACLLALYGVPLTMVLARPSPKLEQMTHGTEFWRVGPIVIEAQRSPPSGFVVNYPIMRIDEYGQIWRDGRNWMDLDEDGLRRLIRDLADFEIEKSRPAAK